MAKTEYVPKMMDRWIMIQRGTPTQDSFGAEVLTWAEFKGRWANVVYGGGGEGQSANKETASMSVSFWVRHVPEGITEKDRILYKEQVYDITAIVLHGRDHFLEIQTEFKR